MPATLPKSVSEERLISQTPFHRGKVRDSYKCPGHPELMIVVTSDRISAHDHVLNAIIPDKGAILNALNVFWKTQVFGPKGIPHDIVAFGKDIDLFLQKRDRGNPGLQARTVVVKRARPIKAELVVRGYLVGTALKEYKKTDPDHKVCGNPLPTGLEKWSKFETPIFTPTTKVEIGHDMPMDVDEFIREFGTDSMKLALSLYETGRNFAEEKGVIIVDTKFEMGYVGNELILIDEALTPDSSRFVESDDFFQALEEGEEPSSFDKQPVRDWATHVGIDKLDPENPEDVKKVHKIPVPDNICAETNGRYRVMCEMTTDMTLDTFEHEVMGIRY